MSDIKELVENLKMNVNVMDYAAKHYGFEFTDKLDQIREEHMNGE